MLAGGSLFKALAPLARAPGVDWARWHVFFVDERNVPHSSLDSNFKGADEALLSKARWRNVGHLHQPLGHFVQVGTNKALFSAKVCCFWAGLSH